MKKTQIFILILSLLAVKIYSQNLISGKIIDGEFNEPLPFANILIRSSSNESNIAGTTSDLDGNFAIEDLENGTYYIEVSFVGYDTKRINELELTGNNDNAIDVTLFPSSNALE